MKVTVAIDNCVPLGAPLPFLGEHGLAMLVDTGDARVLLDTGQSAAIVHNLGLLGVAPGSLDMIAISHGHNDHTGGLFHVLGRAAKRIPVFAHPQAFKPRFSVAGGERHFAGVPHRIEQLTSLGADWRWGGEPTELLPAVWLSGAVPRATEYETGDERLRAADGESGCECQDTIDDDMALFCKTAKGLVVVSGCTHSGLVNMVRHGLAVTGCERLHGWIGGTHLGPVGAPQQQATIAQLKAFDPDFVAANHCTGFRMMADLQQAFGERFIPAFVGTVVEF